MRTTRCVSGTCTAYTDGVARWFMECVVRLSVIDERHERHTVRTGFVVWVVVMVTPPRPTRTRRTPKWQDD